MPKHSDESLREEAEGTLAEEHLETVPRLFSVEFLDLAGTWEDDRSTEEIIRDVEVSRLAAARPVLL